MFNRKNEGKQFMQIKIKPICTKQHIARLNVPQAKTERKKLNNNFSRITHVFLLLLKIFVVF